MKKLALALVAYVALTCAALAQQVGPTNQILCNKQALLAAGPTAITRIQTGVASQNISICGWHVTNTGATGTFSLSYGTGTNCGTGTTTIIPAMNVTSTAPSSDHIDYAWFTLPAGVDLCITPSVATVSAIIYTAQF